MNIRTRRIFGTLAILTAGLLVCGILAITILGAPSWLTGAAADQAARQDADQGFRRSFDDQPANREGVELIGPDSAQSVRFTPAGLRITLPADYDGPAGFHGERPDTGVSIPLGVRGDFEITVAYQIMAEPAAADAGWPQTRLSLDAGVDRGRNIATTLSRRVSTWGGMQYYAWSRQWNEQTGKDQMAGKEFRTVAKSGQLRLQRTGNIVSSWILENADAGYTLLDQVSFDQNDLEDVHIVGSTGGPRATLDVLVTEVNVRAAGLNDRESVRADKRSGKMLLTLGLTLALALGAVIAATLGRRPGKSSAAPAKTHDGKNHARS